MAVEGARNDVRAKEEQLLKARQEIQELTENCGKLGAKLSRLERIATDEKRARSETEIFLKETQHRLSMKDNRIANLEMEKSGIETRYSEMYKLNENLNRVLNSILKRLEDVFPDMESTYNEKSPCITQEELETRVSSLLKYISDCTHNFNTTLQSRHKELEQAEWKLSNATQDIVVLESKNKALREKLMKLEGVKGEHVELLKQYECVVEEMEEVEEFLKNALLQRETEENAAVAKAREERDLFQARLKEAVDDLEELEFERNQVMTEQERAQTEFAKKQTEYNKKEEEFKSKEDSLCNMIQALQKDNKLIDILESQVLELDAALCQKDNMVVKLEEALQEARSELSEAQCAVIEANTSLQNKDLEFDEVRRCT